MRFFRFSTDDSPGVRLYALFCLGAVLVLVLGLLQDRASVILLIPVLIGTTGVLARWRMAPVLLVLSLLLTYLDLTPRGWGFTSRAFEASDLLVSGAALGYVIAHYRLQGLVHTIGPLSPKPTKGRRAAERRSAELVTPREILTLLLSLPVWVLLAQVIWSLLPSGTNDLEIAPRLWRSLVLAWMMAIGAVVLAGTLGYWGWLRRTPAEASMFLQDTLWAQTRREQRRVSRWLAWARLRRERRRQS